MQSMPYYQQGYQAPYQSNVLNNAPMLSHPNGLPPMQHAGLPEMNGHSSQAPKRKQVKNACTNCQKACKKCDDARPCPRCVKYGIDDSCVNSVRKERKKGIKRGPYKRRQKSDDKPKKADGTEATPYAPGLRGAIPFSYPSNLNQYGQPYDPYNQYAAYHKEQMMSQPYVVNPYPPMGYPVMVASSEQPQQPQQPQQGAPNQPHPYPYMIHQGQPSPQPALARPPMMSHGEHYPGQVYYQPQQTHSQPPSTRNSPRPSDSKPELSTQEGFNKPQAMTTPIPSTSTSTTSSPDSASHHS